MPKNHQGRPATYSYPVGLLPAPAPIADTPSEAPESSTTPTPPAASATRAKWAAYATAIGVDPTGLSVAKIKKAVA